MKAVIIDDEAALRASVRLQLQYRAPHVQVLGEASSLAEGVELLKQEQPDVVFLDVELGDGTGFDLLKHFPAPSFSVVFVTAHNKFAVQAFRFSAIDFLLKPIDGLELTEAIAKVEKERSKNNLEDKLKLFLQNFGTQEKSKKRIVLKTLENIYFLEITDIMWCEADRNYTNFHIADGRTILISKNLKEYEDLLTDFTFYRLHHSFLVNLDFIDHIDKKDGGVVVMKNKAELPIAARKKEQLLELLATL